MKIARTMHRGAIALGIMLISSVSANADSIIGISFNNDFSTNGDMGASEVAGVVRSANWNTVTNNTVTPSVINYEDGTASGASLSFSGGHGNWFSLRDNSPDAGDDKFFAGVLDVQGGTMSVTVSGLTFEEYDVYVYRRSDQANTVGTRAGAFAIGDTTYYVRDTMATSHPTDETGYILSTDTTYSGDRTKLVDEIDQGNYVKFSGLTGSEFTLDMLGLSADGDNYPRAKVAGFQIVAVPEPATLGLVALFGGGVLFVRRRFTM